MAGRAGPGNPTPPQPWGQPLGGAAPASTMSLLASEKAVSSVCESLFYLTDTLFAVIKAIHKTPVAIIRLRIVVILFETGVKVVDLLTPYKKGGKIELFGVLLSDAARWEGAGMELKYLQIR